MKKLFTLVFIAGAMSIMSCGQSAEDKAAQEARDKAKSDSIFQANAAGMEAAAPDSTATPDTAAVAPAEPEVH